MERIILITGNFPIYDKWGYKIGEEFVVSHGINERTGNNIIMDSRHPKNISGSFYDKEMMEWVIEYEAK